MPLSIFRLADGVHQSNFLISDRNLHTTSSGRMQWIEQPPQPLVTTDDYDDSVSDVTISTATPVATPDDIHKEPRMARHIVDAADVQARFQDGMFLGCTPIDNLRAVRHRR